jgi:hypothetical protein
VIVGCSGRGELEYLPVDVVFAPLLEERPASTSVGRYARAPRIVLTKALSELCRTYARPMPELYPSCEAAAEKHPNPPAKRTFLDPLHSYAAYPDKPLGSAATQPRDRSA